MSPRLKRRYEIVIAENDSDAVALISRIINGIGWHVLGTVPSLTAAHEIIRKASVDVVLVNASLLDEADPEMVSWGDLDPPLVLIGSGPGDFTGQHHFPKSCFGYVPLPVQTDALRIVSEFAVTQYERLRAATLDPAGDGTAAHDPPDHLRLLETLLNTIPNPVFLKNTEGIYTGCNESFARIILGLPKDRIVGHTLYDFPDQISKSFADEYREQDESLFRQLGNQHYEAQVACADGLVRDFVFNKGIFFDQNDQPAGIIGVMMDVTERNRTGRELKSARNKAEALSQAKSEFLASMSHEIRTPLNSILGLIDLSIQDNLLPEQNENLAAAQDSARHMLHIINDILDLSKIETGKVELEKINFDLQSLLLKIVRSMAFQAEKRNLRCHHHFGAGVPQKVKGDAFRLRQVLINLISNAIKFTKEGEIEITLDRIENGPEGIRTVNGTAEPVTLLFSVRDTGRGIPAKSLDKIFDTFAQGDYSTTRKFGGTGLGLSISKYLVEMMQGRIWVESRVGTGSVFYFTAVFQAADARALKMDVLEPTVISEAERQPLSVLLVEDNAMNAKVATKFLERLGYGVHWAGNGWVALEMLAAKPCDLVLMDLEMPGLDGLETTRCIRAGQAGLVRQNVPIIAMTAHAWPTVKAKCEKAGINDYLSKPVNYYELGSVIEKNTVSPDYYLQELPVPPIFSDEKALLDKATVLSRIGGDYGLLDYLYKSFCEELPGKIECLKDAATHGKYEILYQEAHNLKNNCGAVGAVTCQRLAEELEQAVDAMRSEEVRFLTSKLINELKIIQNTFNEEDG